MSRVLESGGCIRVCQDVTEVLARFARVKPGLAKGLLEACYYHFCFTPQQKDGGPFELLINSTELVPS